jgi:hypothetical protein
MARRQLQFAGTERKDLPPAVVEAGEKWLDLRRDRRIAIDKAKDGKAAVIAVMELNKISKYTVKDPDTDEYIELEVGTKTVLRTSKRNEVDSEVGEGVSGSGVPPTNGESGKGIHPGLIAEAQKAQDEQNVEESAAGDVVVPDKAAPKKKRKAKPAKKGKRNEP